MIETDCQAMESVRPEVSQPARSDEVAFERWLHQDLRRRFGQALREPVPDELLCLLTEH